MPGVRVRTHLLTALALFALFSPCGCTPKVRQAGTNNSGVPIVRVRLFERQSQVAVASTASVAFREAPGVSPRPLNVAKKQEVLISRTSAGWRIGTATVDAAELTLIPVGEAGHLTINGKPYRGECRLVPVGRETFDVVNDVDIEGYLKGVLPRELLRDWHEEAYRAQAVVARTYALYEVKTIGIGRRWDVYDDTRSQVYGGIGAENGLGNSAADATAGVVVAFGSKGHEKIFKAYFSSCCGGITQSAPDAFGDPPLEPLTDQNIGNRCNASPRFNWGPIIISKEDLTRRFQAWGVSKDRPERNMTGVARIDIAHVNRWGRPVRFTVMDANGQRYSLGGTELRSAINMTSTPDTTLYSSFFTPNNEPKVIRFVDGHGYGHGVGLCQWCAQTQAERGVRHEEIILGAYPGASLQRAY